MVEKRLKILLIPLIILSIYYFFPTNSREVENQINTIAKNLSFKKGEHPIEAVRKVRSIMKYFNFEVELTANFADHSQKKVFSKNEIQQKLAIYAKTSAPVKIKIKDILVETKDLIANAKFTALIEREKDKKTLYDAQEIKTEWSKRNDKWVLTSASNIKLLD